MYSKRDLYKPASKQNVNNQQQRQQATQTQPRKGLKAKKLVQGTLISSANNPFSVEEHSSVSSREPKIMPQSTPIKMKEREEAILTPRRSVPAVTEFVSPHPEPLSRCLDLSDTDLNVSHASTSSRQRPVMVCDASHLASSPGSTEVEVVVNYEDSPARVVCHNPNRSNSTKSSPSIRGPLAFECPESLNIEVTNDTPLVDSQIGRSEMIISEHSRSIIREILAEEIGSQDIGSISLYSNHSSPVSNTNHQNQMPLDLSLASLPDGHHYSSKSRSSLKQGISHESLADSVNSKGLPKPVIYPLPPFNLDEDSDNSNSNTDAEHSSPRIKKDGIDRTPKIEAMKAKLMAQIENDASDSETCSLYEYVSQKKKKDELNTEETLKDKKVNHKSMSNTNENAVGAKPKKVVKKKAGVMVPSRFMQSQSTSSLLSRNSSKSSNASNSRMSHNESLMLPKKKNSGKVRDVNRLTSTPTHDDSCFQPHYIDASSIHPGNVTDFNQNNSKLKVSATSPDKDDDLTLGNLDLKYTRYLQALYLSSCAKKSFKEQEKQAMDQMHGLWMLRENKRAELAKSKIELERLKQLVEIDVALDVIEPRLESLVEKLPQALTDHLKLSSALNNTLHQIGGEDLYIPNKSEEEREAFEDQLEVALQESERLLDQIAQKTGHQLSPLHQYVASVETINGSVGESVNGLCEGMRQLDTVNGLCSQLASQMVISMQQ